MSIATMDEVKESLVHEVSLRLATAKRGTLADNVDRIAHIAAQLFCAIEHRPQLIEEELVIARGEQARPFIHSTFADRVSAYASSATSIDSSLHELAVNLKWRAVNGET
jgi:hypothetical protein